MKKINGQRAQEHYETTDEITGEVVELQPEYNTMSRRPGVGNIWLSKYMGDCYPKDFVTRKGRSHKPPKYYDSLYEVFDPKGFEEIKKLRKQKIELNGKESTPKRLADREKVKLAQISKLTRQL